MSTELNILNETTEVNVTPEVIQVGISGIQTILVNVTNGQGPQGEKGDKGDTGISGINGVSASITIGTVSTGDPGTNASVVNTGTPLNAVLNFTIPKGNDGNSNFLYYFITDYDYDISGSRNGNNKTFTTSNNFVSGTTKVYVNGLRQTIGGNYDYTEQGNRTIRFNYNIDNGDLITVDYIKQ